MVNNWQKLCRHIKPLINTGVSEDALQQSFEVWLQDIFNWDEASVKHQVPVRIGKETKIADIVLHGSDFDIVIEMKAPGVTIGNGEIGQLTSYMRFLNCKYGLLVGNKLKMLCDFGEALNPVKEAVDINFDPDAADGIDLGEILEKSVCSNEKLKEYAVERIENMKIEKEIERLKKELMSNDGKKIKNFVKEGLVSENCREQVIIDILNDIQISFKQTVIGTGKCDPGDETWRKIKILKEKKHSSWVLLREGCESLLTGKTCRANAKSFANTIVHEVGLTPNAIIDKLDERDLGL